MFRWFVGQVLTVLSKCFLDYFKKMQTWLAKVDLGKLLSDEESVRARFRIRWVDEVARAKANTLQRFEDGEIEGLVNTRESPFPHCR